MIWPIVVIKLCIPDVTAGETLPADKTLSAPCNVETKLASVVAAAAAEQPLGGEFPPLPLVPNPLLWTTLVIMAYAAPNEEPNDVSG